MAIDNFIVYDKRTNIDDTKIFDNISKDKVKCENCGHTMIMSKVDRMICSHCGYWVYRNEQAKFKYKIKEVMIKNGK